LIEDLIEIIDREHLVCFILVEQIQSHSKPIRSEYISLALMKREVSFEYLHLSRLSFGLGLFEPSVGSLGKLIELHKELADHFLLNWLLVGLLALDFVPKLDFNWLAKRLLYLRLVKHVKLHKGCFINIELL
jgi:hypothetical protein